MGKNETIKQNVANVSVHKDDLHINAGVWKGYAFTATAATTTEPLRVIHSSAVTILGVVANITTEASAAGTFVVENSAGTDIVAFATQSLAKTFSSGQYTAAGTAVFVPYNLSAGNSVVITLGATSNEIKGALYLLTIATPS
jgi:hypothetical protein